MVNNRSNERMKKLLSFIFISVMSLSCSQALESSSGGMKVCDFERSFETTGCLERGENEYNVQRPGLSDLWVSRWKEAPFFKEGRGSRFGEEDRSLGSTTSRDNFLPVVSPFLERMFQQQQKRKGTPDPKPKPDVYPLPFYAARG